MKPEYIQQIHRLLGGIKQVNDRYHGSPIALYRDLNRIDVSVLGYAALDSKMTIKDIRERISVPQSTLSSSISRLSKKGLVRRVINEQDSRSFHLVLTEAGQRMVESHHEVNLKLAADILATLDSDDEREFLIRLLSKVMSRLE